MFCSGTSLLLRAYHVDSGNIEWEVKKSVEPVREYATTVALNNSAVYVGGSSGQGFVYSEILVQGYDAVTGTLLWDDRSHRSGSFSGTGAVGLALGKNRLFVAGSVSGVGTDFVIRAYDVRKDGKDR